MQSRMGLHLARGLQTAGSQRKNTMFQGGDVKTTVLFICALILVSCASENTKDSAKAGSASQKEMKMSSETKTGGETASAREVALATIPFNKIDGQPAKLADYQGDVVLIVNVASECGYTPQYEGLEKLYEKYKDRGLTILGFPANNFGAQEPGSDEEILKFCQSRFSVTFPMMSKVSVKGDDQHPLFAYLTSHAEPTGEIPWNFHKFLLDREGRIVGRFNPDVTPLSEELTSKIEETL